MPSSINARTALLATVAFTATAASAQTHPCGRVGELWAAQTASGVKTPIVDAPLAYECLNSVPIIKDAALKFIDELVPYLEWQSDLSYKKNPPKGYFYPAYDLWAEVADVRAKIASDVYKTEYAWQSDLFLRAIGPGHDGHMYLYPDMLDTVHWQRGLALVSVSKDGLELPIVKVYEDVVSNSSDASIVTKINGKDAVSYIEDWVNRVGENQDRDANYNMMFYSKAQEVTFHSRGNYHSGGRPKFVYPGETTTLTFQNGSVVETRNRAELVGNWTGVVDASSFVQKLLPFALPGAKSPKREALPEDKSTIDTMATKRGDKPSWPGYPNAEIVSQDNSVSGYFLKDAGFEDVAVIAITSFSPLAINVQKTVQEFYAMCVKAGKKKLVVDLQMNEGGFTFLAYDMFRQLFPDIVQDATTRMRLSPGFVAVSKVASEICANFDPVLAEDEDNEDLVLLCQSPMSYGYDLDQYLKHFKSYEQMYTPFEFNGDKFTNLSAWDLGNWVDTSSSYFGFGMNVTGYGNRVNFTRPFSGPDDIVVLYDGYCSSSCTIFSQCMIHDGGVKTVSFGGRPQPGLTQGVGGVKGPQTLFYKDIKAYVGRATRMMKGNNTDISKELGRYTDYVINRSGGAAINFRDSILPEHRGDGTPAQHVAEYSDCRLFWTEDMIRSPEAIWRAAAGAAFKGNKCAAGGFENKKM
ncbi:Peptidase s41 family protein [Apiospora arundinis]|uniref:Peptidase S41 family protein ustP n=1 Tax=Apiospora arundinis TaxID=335852 RepID=A0ABR2HSS4_9PEZI